MALTLTPDPLHINLLGGPISCLELLEGTFEIEMNSFYKRHCLNKTGKGAGGKFYGPSIKKVLKNLEDLQKTLPDWSIPLIDFLRNTAKVHKMCTADKLSKDYFQILKYFKDSFEICHEFFDMNLTE